MPYDNPYSGQSPILGPQQRAIRMYAQLMQLKNDAADRANALQQQALNNKFREREFALQEGREKRQVAQDTYSQAQDKLQNTVSMAQMGARLGNPDLETALTKALGAPRDPRTAATLPSGETYYLPTEKERTQKALEAAVKQGQIGIANKILEADQLFKYKLGEKEYEARLRQQYPTPTAPHYERDDKGNITAIQQTPEGFRTSNIGQFGTTKNEPKGADIAKAAESERLRVQGLIDQARQAGETVKSFEIFNEKNPGRTPTAQEVDSVVKAKARMTALWQQAAREAQLAAQKYPDYLEGGAGEGGYAYIQPRQR